MLDPVEEQVALRLAGGRPAFEAVVDQELDWQVGVVFAEFGSALGTVAAGRRRYRALAVSKIGAPAVAVDSDIDSLLSEDVVYRSLPATGGQAR